MSYFENELSRKQQKEEKLTKEVTVLEHELQNTKNEMESLRQSANLQSAEIESLRQSANLQSAEIESLRRSTNLQSTENENQHMQEMLQEKCDAQAQELADLRNQVSRLTSLRSRRPQEESAQLKKAKAEADQHKEQLKTARSQLNDALHELGAVQLEMEEWKKMVNTTRNVEEWVQSLSSFIYKLKVESNQLLADFDEEENHVPTKLKTEAASHQAVTELTEKLRSSKREQMELYGVLRVLKEDIKKAQWQPEKLDELLANSRKEYSHAYLKGKIQVRRRGQPIDCMCISVVSLEARSAAARKNEKDL